MEEIGIEISHHRSKSLFEFFDTDIDIIITACNGAKAVCPVFPERGEPSIRDLLIH